MKNCWFAAIPLLLFASCVTVNIYFPAEEVQEAADKIVEEVWGAEGPQINEETTSLNLLLGIFMPATAYAEQNINVTTPQIRAIKDSIKARSAKLKKYMNSGNVGLANNGMLQVRSTGGLNLKQVSKVKKLVNAENSDRSRLYQEIAAANGFPGKAAEVQSIFAKSWRDQAAAGWYVQNQGGGWSKK